MVVHAHGVFGTHVAHNLDTETVGPSAQNGARQMGFIQIKITLSKCFGYQNGETSGTTMPY